MEKREKLKSGDIMWHIDRRSRLYPERLQDLEDAPRELYFIGEPELTREICVAVVGARKATGYGSWAAYNSGRVLAESGIVTVSGMALGCDASAHRGAVEHGGKTIAVLAGGLDICYPRANLQLWKRIKREGLLVTEYPPGTSHIRRNFPKRNRIISGLSDEVVIAEAGISSGSLITAELALDQGRTVMAFPGNISAISSMGCNKLIADGAGIVTGLGDIITNMNLEPGVPGEETSLKLTDGERRILEVISREGEVTADRIARLTGMETSHTNALIATMEVRGILSSSMGKVFMGKRR